MLFLQDSSPKNQTIWVYKLFAFLVIAWYDYSYVL
ncbi:hypothetical protein BBR47_56420 [Brevibacillus brevis NBRC 100599]|uniref:Uncharacterized protein n=1 Tax=Brevibacillus brevis (strain 47 / JCM 6285 / NBRC 100599) TaxID=358681 RepID=C0Z8J2_BREBN|nr:hypothetical protein BBR47_56420 [Brevibacillus brevis NBRC 100599]